MSRYVKSLMLNESIPMYEEFVYSERFEHSSKRIKIEHESIPMYEESPHSGLYSISQPPETKEKEQYSKTPLKSYASILEIYRKRHEEELPMKQLKDRGYLAEYEHDEKITDWKKFLKDTSDLLKKYKSSLVKIDAPPRKILIIGNQEVYPFDITLNRYMEMNKKMVKSIQIKTI